MEGFTVRTPRKLTNARNRAQPLPALSSNQQLVTLIVLTVTAAPGLVEVPFTML